MKGQTVVQPGDRRPHLLFLTPSKMQTWEGMYRDGCPISGDQQETLKAIGKDWRKVKTVACTRSVGGQTFEFECPVINQSRDKLLVVTPRGYRAWISRDGRITGRERTL